MDGGGVALHAACRGNDGSAKANTRGLNGKQHASPLSAPYRSPVAGYWLASASCYADLRGWRHT
jgi:hypothetical protein